MDGSPGGWAEGNDLVGHTVGHYRVEAFLGGGGMGRVYLAQDLRFPRKVALKLMAPELRQDPEFHRRFLEEAEKAIRIADRRIAQVHDVLEDGGNTFLVMEYVPGPTLRERLRGPLEVDVFLPLAIECTEALATAHRQGIVHRDIKPENYVVTPAGVVKLLDLGIAKETHRPDGDSTVTVTGATTRFAGTPCYMAPEALLFGQADARSDIFSLGVMFYEMVAGANPFRCDQPAATTDRILHLEPVPLVTANPRAPAAIQGLVSRMLAKDPSLRPPTAHDVLLELLEIQKQKTSLSTAGTVPLLPAAPAPSPAPAPGPETPRSGDKSPARRFPWRWMAVFGVLAVGATFVLYGLRHRGAAPPPLPVKPSVAIASFATSEPSVDDRAVALGLTRAVARVLSRFTDSRVLDPIPRPGRNFHPLACVDRDNFTDCNLVLTGEMRREGRRVQVRIELRDARDSSLVREAQLQAPSDDALALTDRTAQATAAILDLDVDSAELRSVMHPHTSNPAAHRQNLAGLGFYSAFDGLTASSRARRQLAYRLFPEVSESQEVGPLRATLLNRAESAFLHAIALDSTDADAWLGAAMVSQGQMKGHDKKAPEWAASANLAAARCQRALEIDPQHPDAHAVLGDIYASLGRDPAAIAEFELANRLDRTNDLAIRSLGAAYQRARRTADVEAVYKKAIADRPDYYLWHAWYAWFCLQESRLEEAARSYDRAIELAPRDPNLYAGVGAVCMLQGRYQSAVPYLASSIDLQPMPNAYSNLGTTFFLMRRFAQAESLYQRAIELGVYDYYLWGNLGDAYHWDPASAARAPEAYRQAVTLAQKQLEQTPNDPVLLSRLAHYRAKVGEATQALGDLRKALAQPRLKADVLYKAALVFDQLSKTDSAFVYLDKALAAGYSPLWMEDTVELDHLRSDPRYGRLRAKSPGVK